MTNLRGLYNGVTLEGKQLLLKTGFEHGLVYDGKLFRIATINPALVANYMKMKEKGLLVVEQPDDFLLKSWSCTVSGNWFEPLVPFVQKMLCVKRYSVEVCKSS